MPPHQLTQGLAGQGSRRYHAHAVGVVGHFPGFTYGLARRQALAGDARQRTTAPWLGLEDFRKNEWSQLHVTHCIHVLMTTEEKDLLTAWTC